MIALGTPKPRCNVRVFNAAPCAVWFPCDAGELSGRRDLALVCRGAAQIVRYQGPDGRLYFTNLPCHRPQGLQS
jgi:hypothetical protein